MRPALRCGRGFGDSVYLQSVARHLLETRYASLVVKSDWPDVFRPLAGRIEVVPFAKTGIDILAHYSTRKGRPGTTQFQDCCASAGIVEPVELRLDWKPSNQALIDRLRAPGRPVLVVQLPRTPMGRTDGFGASLLPDCRAIQRMINRGRDEGRTVVQIGAGEPLYRFAGIDIDLANRTSVADTIDAVWAADTALGYVSFLVPLAESLGKPAVFVWSRRGLVDRQQYVRQITPQKILHAPTSMFVMDDQV